MHSFPSDSETPTASLKLRFLGTGTSTGVPVIGCDCDVCRSTDLRDRRLRTSALVSTQGLNLLIDCGPDFRTQILDAGSPRLDALLVTHHHYDHLGGVDDLRPYCTEDSPFQIYCDQAVAERLHQVMPYSFGNKRYPGSPVLGLNKASAFKPIHLRPANRRRHRIEIMPLPIDHAPGLGILGYKIGHLAYITDCKTMPPATLEAIKGIDTLVINALRIKEHRSHMNLSEALNVIKSVNPRVAYLTHISHQMGLHADTETQLPPNVHLAYDGLEIKVGQSG